MRNGDDGPSRRPSAKIAPQVIDGLRLFHIEVDTSPLPNSLTDAEREVIRWVLAGHSNREIAEIRGSRERTVANQLASIYRKLGVNSRSELASLLSG